jgi:hypothetical protein
MKPPRHPQGQFSYTIPELIQHLKRLYSDMEADPTLTESAKHIKRAVTELETARHAAFEVYQECLAAHGRPRGEGPAEPADQQREDDAEWLRNLQPASPLKQ